MLDKLLVKDLKRNMRWMWVLFVATLVVACFTRCCKELGHEILFFKILSIFFDSVFYSLLVNVILQPFLRNFLNFTKSFYGDESYLTHTLPVTKNQLINSKFLTALIEIVLGFVTLVISLLIMFYSPTFFTTIKILIFTIVTGNVSVGLVITLFILLVVIEFLMFITLIYFSIVIAYRQKEKRVLKTFLLTVALSFVSASILSIVMVAVLAINGLKLTTATLMMTSTQFISVLLSGIVVYFLVSVVFYFLTKKEFNKGVNVD